MAGALTFFGWVWLLTGVEFAELEAETLTVRRRLAGWERARSYRLAQVTRMRVAGHWERGRFSPIHKITFDYGGRTIAFARRVNASELERIVAALADRHPSIAS
jgi:hypothetical protein